MCTTSSSSYTKLGSKIISLQHSKFTLNIGAVDENNVKGVLRCMSTDRTQKILSTINGILLILCISLFILILLQKYMSPTMSDVQFINEQVKHYTNQSFKNESKPVSKHTKLPIGRIDAGNSYGTGFIVDKHTVVTAYHVVDQRKDQAHMYFLPNQNGVLETHVKITDVHKINTQNGLDIAVLHTDADLSSYGKLKLTTHTPDLYSPTTTYGYPGNYYNSSGIRTYQPRMYKSHIQYAFKNQIHFFVAGTVKHGQSGSPVLNNKGEAYGIIGFTGDSNGVVRNDGGGDYFTNDILKEVNHYRN